AAYLCRPSMPQRSALVARMLARSICAGRASRNRGIRLARVPVNRRRQPFEVAFKIGVIDLGEVAAFERIDPSLDLRAEDLELEAVFLPALLEYAQSVADGFTCVLVFA